jgi:hypothetical protein
MGARSRIRALAFELKLDCGFSPFFFIYRGGGFGMLLVPCAYTVCQVRRVSWVKECW